MVLYLAHERAERSIQALDLEPRYTRRLSDKMAVVFYAACESGNLEAAAHLLIALEYEIARSTRLGRDTRDDGNDLAAVRARLDLERHRQAEESSRASSVSALSTL